MVGVSTATTFTLTGSLSDAGGQFATGMVQGWIELANVENNVLIDTTTTSLIVGRWGLEFDDKGDFTKELPSTAASAGYDPNGGFMYRLCLEHRTAAPNSKKQPYKSEPFALTANRTIAYALSNTIELTTISAADWVDFQAKYEEVVALVAVDAGTMVAVDANPASAFRVQQDARQTAAIDAAVAPRLEVREAPLSPYRYGFVGDNVADDTTALQDTLDALPANGGEINLPHAGNSHIYTALSVTKPTKLVGRGTRHQRIATHGCNGFNVAAGVPLHLEGFELVTTRHSTTPNTLVAVKSLGTTTDRMTGHVYRDMFIDGFQTAFQVGYLWESTFEKVDTAYGALGIDAYGLSVNNTVKGCNLTVNTESGSRAIRFLGVESPTVGTHVTSEGWMITDNTLFGGETNLELVGVRWFTVADNIIDWASLHGILINSNGTYYGGNHRIHDNFIAVSNGTAGVRVLNQLDNPGRSRNVIHDNEILGYGTGVNYGVLLDGAYSGSIVHDNVIKGCLTNDIAVTAVGSRVHDNTCLSAIAANIYSSSVTEMFGNSGVVSLGGSAHVYSLGPNGRRETVGTGGAPTTGTWAVGDRRTNTTPVVGQPKSWVCTVAGTPGTWVSEGNL